MPERVYRNVDLDLDDLADAVVDWFVRDGFTVQDFVEGSTIFLQAKKESLVSKLSFSSQALNVRLTPLARGFRVDVVTGEWLDKGIGAGVAGFALRFINPLVGLGAGVATGYGIYQQLKLPERVLEYVELYVNEHGRPDGAEEELRPRGSRRFEGSVDEELSAMRPKASAPASPSAAGGQFCTSCGTGLAAGAAFCHSCGAKVRVSAPPAAPAAEPGAARHEGEQPRPRPDVD